MILYLKIVCIVCVGVMLYCAARIGWWAFRMWVHFRVLKQLGESLTLLVRALEDFLERMHHIADEVERAGGEPCKCRLPE